MVSRDTACPVSSTASGPSGDGTSTRTTSGGGIRVATPRSCMLSDIAVEEYHGRGFLGMPACAPLGASQTTANEWVRSIASEGFADPDREGLPVSRGSFDREIGVAAIGPGRNDPAGDAKGRGPGQWEGVD